MTDAIVIFPVDKTPARLPNIELRHVLRILGNPRWAEEASAVPRGGTSLLYQIGAVLIGRNQTGEKSSPSVSASD